MPDTSVNSAHEAADADDQLVRLEPFAPVSVTGGEGSECVVMPGQTLVGRSSSLGMMGRG